MEGIEKLDKVYVLHHLPFKERGEIIQNRLLEEDIKYELVSMFSPYEIDYEKELEGWNTTEPIEIVHPYGSFISTPMKISVTSLSLVLKHLWCIKQQVENKYENILIFEDDVEIIPNFKQYLNNNMKDFCELQQTADVTILMMGISHGRTTKAYVPGKFAHYGINQKTRCLHAYVVNIKAAIEIVNNCYPINNPADFLLDSIIAKTGIKVAWSEPGLVQKYQHLH